MATPGRKRKEGKRYPNGSVYRHEPAVLEIFWERRAEKVGRENARDPRAGQPLGQILLQGRITEEQYLAGEKLGALWRRWAAMAGVPYRHASAVGARLPGISTDVDPEEWEKVKQEMHAVHELIKATVPGWILTMGILEDICVTEEMPRRFDKNWLGTEWHQGWELLNSSLNELATYFQIKKN